MTTWQFTVLMGLNLILINFHIGTSHSHRSRSVSFRAAFPRKLRGTYLAHVTCHLYVCMYALLLAALACVRVCVCVCPRIPCVFVFGPFVAPDVDAPVCFVCHFRWVSYTGDRCNGNRSVRFVQLLLWQLHVFATRIFVLIKQMTVCGDNTAEIVHDDRNGILRINGTERTFSCLLYNFLFFFS